MVTARFLPVWKLISIPTKKEHYKDMEKFEKSHDCIFTPPVSHGGQKYTEGSDMVENPVFQKYTINVDSLIFCVKGHLTPSENKLGDDFIRCGDFILMLHYFGSGDNRYTGNFNYEHTYAIHEINRETGVISDRLGLIFTTVREGRVIDGELSKIEVSNHVLYTRGYTFILSSLIEQLGLSFNNFTRLDLAIDGASSDGEGFVSDFMGMYGNAEDFARLGRARVDTVDVGGNITFYVGSKGAKRVRGYCKSAEIEQNKQSGKADKDYIIEFWERNNLDVSGDVDRFEIELHRKQIQEISLDNDTRLLGVGDLEDSSILAAVAKVHIDKFCQFAKVDEKQKNRSRWERIDLVDWDELNRCEVDRSRTVCQKQITQGAKQAIDFQMKELSASSAIAIRKRFGRLGEREAALSEQIDQLKAKNDRIEDKYTTPKKYDWIATNEERILVLNERLQNVHAARAECAYYIELSDRSNMERNEIYNRCKAMSIRYGLFDWFMGSLERWEGDYMREMANLECLEQVKERGFRPEKSKSFFNTVFAV